MIRYQQISSAACYAVKRLNVRVLLRLLVKPFSVFASIILLSSCGGSDGRPCAKDVSLCIVEDPPPVEVWWEAPIPDFSENPDRPVISLLGERTQVLSLGEFYLEEGALAVDEQDGDISGQIVIDGDVDTNTIGDYLVRYSVTDSDDNVAIEHARVIRVTANTKASITRRPLGTTFANFGYFEHLPLDYGETTEQKPPLLIYLHGSGANLEFHDNQDPVSSLDAVIENHGIPKLIEDGEWDDTLPFVMVAPHLGALPDVGFKVRLDAFVDYAIHTYDIDINRVYITGWSSGGFLSSAYSVDFPDKIAAVVPIASGLALDVEDLPDDFCNIEAVPVWMFHGTGDEIISHGDSIKAYHAISDLCQSRVPPKLSLLTGARHHIHHAVFDLSALAGGMIDGVEIEYDPRFQPYDESIYQWLLSHSLEDR